MEKKNHCIQIKQTSKIKERLVTFYVVSLIVIMCFGDVSDLYMVENVYASSNLEILLGP